MGGSKGEVEGRRKKYGRVADYTDIAILEAGGQGGLIEELTPSNAINGLHILGSWDAFCIILLKRQGNHSKKQVICRRGTSTNDTKRMVSDHDREQGLHAILPVAIDLT